MTDGLTYELVDGGRGIRCLLCGLTSYHTEDVRQRYCGHCHQFHEFLELPIELIELNSLDSQE